MTESGGGDDVVIEMSQLSPTDGDGSRDGASGDGETPSASSTRPKGAKVPWTNSLVPSREERDVEFDEQMLRRAIADTGRWAYGTISVEAWIFDEGTGKLVRPKRAFWFDPVAVDIGKGNDNESLMRLVDEEREDFVGPDPLAPGVGLAGALWTELVLRNNFRLNMGRTSVRRTSMMGFEHKNIVWREVEPIALQLAVEAGIGLAAGVRFHFHSTQGMILYMARSNTDPANLKSELNEGYLLCAADVIGSIVALRDPRHVLLAERRTARESVRRRARQGLAAAIRMGGGKLLDSFSDKAKASATPSSTDGSAGLGRKDSATTVQSEAPTQLRGCFEFTKNKVLLWTTKWRGANNQPPPRFTWQESLWTFTGCFLTLLSLLTLSDAISEATNGDLSLVLGPFGALMTLHYSLTAAPAAQPRNALLGQTVSLSIAMGMTYTRLETKVRRCLGTSLAIMIMARLGVTHPPAGAACLIFTGGAYNWAHMGIMLVGNVIAIFFATLINDMNVKRQYPTFWGFRYWIPGHSKTKKSKDA